GAVLQRFLTRILELFVYDPLVVLDRITAVGRGVADRIGRGVEGPGHGRLGALHARHVIGREHDRVADVELRIGGLLDSFGWGTSVGGVVHAFVVGLAGLMSGAGACGLGSVGVGFLGHIVGR